MGWFGSLAPRNAEDDLLDESRMPFGVGMPQEAPPKVSAKTGANVATGLVPGSGIADVLGYLPNYEGGTEPSFGQNIKSGQYGRAGLQTLGAAGDVAMAVGAVPLGLGIKEVAAAAKPVKEATKTAEEARAAFHDFAHSLGETHAGQAEAPLGGGTEAPGGAAGAGTAPVVAGGGGGGTAGVGAAPLSPERLAAAQAARDAAAGGHETLPGLPEAPLKVGDRLYIPGPIGRIRDIADSYMRQMKIKPSYHLPPTEYHELDKDHARAIAKAYDDMVHAPDDPAVRASYEAMAKETEQQFWHIRQHHPDLELIPNPPGHDPYASTPRLAAIDVAENNRLHYFPSQQGFGTGEQGGIDLSKHPMLQPSGVRDREGNALPYNDLFRIVHDYFGHLAEGNGFRAAGEDMAWRLHAPMYSDLARPAMTSETRGQNSWVNHGPHAEANKGASGADTIYAPQKVGLMPEWTMRDRGSPEPITTYRGGPHAHPMVDMSYIGTGEGSGVRGEGMYSAEAQPIANDYRLMTAVLRDPLLKKYGLTPFDADSLAVDLKNAGGKHEDIVRDMQDHLENMHAAKDSGNDTSMALVNQIKRAENMIKYLNDPNRAKGHMYQLAIDRPPEQFLHWDTPMGRQTDYVKQKLGPMLEEQTRLLEKRRQADLAKAIARRDKAGTSASNLMQQVYAGDIAAANVPTNLQNFTGEQIYRLAGHHALGKPFTSDMLGSRKTIDKQTSAAAAQYLRAKGLSGVKYLAGKNFGVPRGTEGSHNYVSFYPERILKRYAIPGMLGGAAFGSLAAGQRDDGT